MTKNTCTYFIEHPNNLGVGYFGEKVLCDNYDCSSHEGKFFSAQVGCDTGFCKTNAAKNPELEAKLDEMRMDGINKAHKGIEPMDPKTGKPFKQG